MDVNVLFNKMRLCVKLRTKFINCLCKMSTFTFTYK